MRIRTPKVRNEQIMINYTDQVLIKFKRSQYRYLKDKADKYRMPISALIRDILIKYNL